MTSATASGKGPAAQALSLPEELLLALLNEESGYFHQVTRMEPELRHGRRSAG